MAGIPEQRTVNSFLSEERHLNFRKSHLEYLRLSQHLLYFICVSSPTPQTLEWCCCCSSCVPSNRTAFWRSLSLNRMLIRKASIYKEPPGASDITRQLLGRLFVMFFLSISFRSASLHQTPRQRWVRGTGKYIHDNNISFQTGISTNAMEALKRDGLIPVRELGQVH